MNKRWVQLWIISTEKSLQEKCPPLTEPPRSSTIQFFLQLPAFWFVYSQQGFERNNATTSAPIIIQIAIIRILRLALRHRLCSRRSSYSDLPWASPPLATATGRKDRKLIEALQKLVISAASRGIGWGCFRFRFTQAI